MNITFLLPRYGWQPSGGFSVVYTYASFLAARGHDVTVVHPRSLPSGGWPQPSGLYARLHHAAGRLRDRMLRPSLRWADPDPRVRMMYIPEISDAFVPDGDVIIATWWSTAEAALSLSAEKGEQFHLIQGEETWYGAEERVHAAWRAPLHKIFISRWLMERVREVGVPEMMGTVIPNGIDHEVFRVTQPIDNRPARVAMMYSAAPFKGGDIGLEILRRAKDAVPDLRAILFGVGRAPAGLPSWIQYVRGAGRAQLADAVYNRCSVYLCPSLSEGWHLPATEAMACGCAIVTSDIGGVRDYARDEDTALLFPIGDTAAGADRLVALLRNDTRRVELARRAGEVIRNFSWERSGARLAELLEQHMAGKSRTIA